MNDTKRLLHTPHQKSYTIYLGPQILFTTVSSDIIKRLPRQFSMPTSPHSIYFNLCFYHSFSAGVSSTSNLSYSYCLMDFLLFLFPILLLSWLVLLFQWPGLGLVNNFINYWWPYTPNHLPLYPKGWDYSICFS